MNDKLIAVRPSARQLAWQRMEFYGFVHFGMNTMTGREWGDGTDRPSVFDPAAVDADQWVAELKNAGMTGVIITAKHHDGFCLWPTATTSYSVVSSPFRGDVVGLVAEAARAHGLKLGIYLSPWDRNNESYGTGKGYDDLYVAQLTELLTGYGPVFTVWLDGANGEGPNGKVQEYDWDRYYAVVRDLQPDAVISVCGPDVRWCGNEAGETRPDEWSVVPRALRNVERIAAKSQQIDDGEFSRLVRSDDQDLGSRAVLAGCEDDLVWYPAEVNTSIRPGWFYHSAEDDAVRTPDELFQIYLKSVGGNSTFLLNVPPGPDGRIHDDDVVALRGLGERIADFRARAIPATRGGDLTLHLPEPRAVEAVVVGEDITQGQRVENLVVHGLVDGDWTVLASARSVGHRRILTFDPVTVEAVWVEIRETRGEPVISRLEAIGAAR
ncbi:alpha-L-fucosidase [Actinoplanes derwentensis]|uniref:alpha-L-fucosidase n=1 Tax=Actinoplanes derwentensis TaxID=113562 RepID=A0A1H2DEN9_9ACTN|nr:alpha-L-fucosidase [Actinoplanes derwentensis]GID84803.1 alpha-L-fucosidase [Actinoplanes derwentensis]SDT81057.1 alpha-L-fucosidase [Actinoplanes derwentensis]